MKKILVCAMLLLGSICVFAQNKADQVVGIWQTQEKDGTMQVYACGNKYCGKLLKGSDIVNSDGSSKKDVENPDPNLRSRDIVGMRILKGLVFDGEQYYEEGRIYNASNGKTYNCYVWLEDGVLHLRGYLGIPALGQTSKWNRVQ